MKHIKVKAQPDSKKETVKKISAERLSICVKEPAEGNLANKRIMEILRAMYPSSRIKLVAGHHSPHKIFELSDIRV